MDMTHLLYPVRREGRCREDIDLRHTSAPLRPRNHPSPARDKSSAAPDFIICKWNVYISGAQAAQLIDVSNYMIHGAMVQL
jgi:hypothetical protein